jgi:hypothetical protein
MLLWGLVVEFKILVPLRNLDLPLKIDLSLKNRVGGAKLFTGLPSL